MICKTSIQVCLLLALVPSALGFGQGDHTTSKPSEVVELDAYSPVTYTDFAREDKCDNDDTEPSQCWVSQEGQYFRYGCKPGDNRVYTDECVDGCDGDCDNSWSWAGEYLGLCYDDGQASYSFTCHPDGIPTTDEPTEAGTEQPTEAGTEQPTEAATEQPTEAATDAPTEQPIEVSAFSCGDLGWDLLPGSELVCAESKVDNGQCSQDLIYEDAVKMCATAGGRLCSKTELEENEAAKTGCKADGLRTWSQTSCDSGHFTTAGGKKYAKSIPTECTSDFEQLVVRCCADVGPITGAVPGAGLPEGFRQAMSTDYDKSDAACGTGEPLDSTPCWTNPNDGLSQRFACQDGNKYIWTQNCGQDDKCSQENCSGEWTSTGEVVNRCYSAPDVLYQYSC